MITPACLYTFGKVYWVLLMGHICRTSQLAPMVLLSIIIISTIQLDSIALAMFQFSVSTCHNLGNEFKIRMFNILAPFHVHIISLFTYMLFQLYSILHT